eukprot:Seg1005.2 transcript_id=Seg1005.2/GoldUCD/mRNA.D3Y31 product="Major facilitator superfamily domain-containing protein 8" protein_id=Seg1005.2/GoldUCD/D3Y31
MTLYISTDSVKLNSTTNTTKQRETNVGCPSQYDWCKNTPQIWLPQMLVAVVLFAIGFSTCIGLILSLYTKVLGFKKQGTSVGIISASGNIARIAAPLVGSASYVDIGPRYTYSWMCAMVFVAIVTYIALYKKMAPKKFEFCFEKENTSSDINLEGRTNQHIQSNGVMYVTPL